MAIALATLLGASVLAFGVLHLAPMDPARYFVQFRFQQTRPGVREEQIRALADWYGLQDPILVQYGRWLARAVTGNFGRSLTTGREVGPELGRRLPWTIVLTIPSIAAAWLVAILLASATAGRGALGRMAGTVITAGTLTPVFLLASVLVYIFAVRLTWIPILPPFELNLLDTYLWRAMLLPAVSLALPIGAVMARRLSADLRASLKAPHVTAARARGTGERGVFWRHALRAATRPLLARPLAVLSVLFGAVLVAEDIFGWPGIGRVFMRAISARDITAIQGSLFLLAALVLAAECLIRILGSRQSPEDSVAAAPSGRAPGQGTQIRSPGLMLRIAIGVAGVIVVSAVAAPLLARFPPDLVQLEEIQVGPSLRHWMGTDASGRDMFSRLLFASRVSLALAVLPAAAAVTAAGLLVALAVWRGRAWTDVATGVTRTILATPALAIALAVISIAGRAPALVGGVFAFCGLAHVTGRLRVLLTSAMRWPFVDAARLAGASPMRIGERHLFPHLARPLLAAAAGLVPTFLMLEATLGFFGFSLTPTIPTWGTLLWRGREALHRGDWWLLAFPMLFVAASAWASLRIAAALADPPPPTYVAVRKLVLGREWGEAASATTVSRTAEGSALPGRARTGAAPTSAAAPSGSGNGGSGDGSSL
ncbi:MAG: ABC transporter permease subunit [Armatimonadota bacterium]